MNDETPVVGETVLESVPDRTGSIAAIVQAMATVAIAIILAIQL